MPWAEADEARQLAAGQIGVSWLPDDLWSRGKCGLKVLQYQAAGLPVVANPVGCQSEMIRPGENGILATDARRVGRGRPTARGRPRAAAPDGAAARRRVETDYSLSAWSETFVDSMTGGSGPLPSPSASWKVDRPAPTAGGRSGLRAPRRPGPDHSRASTRLASDEHLHPTRTDPPVASADARRTTPVDAVRRRPLPRMFKPPEWEWSGFGEIGWWVRAGSPWRDILLGPDGLRLDEWRAAGCVSTVQAGPHRIVYRVELPEGTLYIKHFLVPNRRAILRQWFRRGKGRNEGKRSQQLAAIGVPTIWPIALGEQRKRKFLFENYLVTPEIADAIPLDEFAMRAAPELARAEAVARPPEAGRGPGRHDRPAPRRRVPPRGLPPRQHPGPVPGPGRARADHDRPGRAAATEAGRLEGRRAEPGAARSFLLAAQQPDRSLPLPEELPEAPAGPVPAIRPRRAADRGLDPGLGRAALAALGPPLPVIEQVLRSRRPAKTSWGVASRDLDPARFRR